MIVNVLIEQCRQVETIIILYNYIIVVLKQCSAYKKRVAVQNK